jgi:hypothetical protein
MAMRLTRSIAVAAGVLCAASCSGSPEGTDVTGARGPGLHIEDDGDPFGGDPDVDPGIGSAPPDSLGSGTESAPSGPDDGSTTSPDPTDSAEPADTRDVCLTACEGGPAARAAFCRLLFDPVLQESCMKRVSGSLTACNVWCYWKF